MSGTVVNLNKARKARERAAGRAQADANSLKHGRLKAERLAEAARAEKVRRELDQAKRDK